LKALHAEDGLNSVQRGREQPTCCYLVPGHPPHRAVKLFAEATKFNVARVYSEASNA